MNTQPEIATTELYEQDFCLWVEATLELLRTGQLDRLDIEHLIEEVEGMSNSEKHALESNLEIVLMHLLKYKYQPEKRSNSWRYTLIEHRIRLHKAFRASPSLRRYFLQEFEDCYQNARKLASVETEMLISIFPEDCPFTSDQVLDEDFYPQD